MHACFEQDDLIGPAELALVQQAAKFDPTRGVPFRAFALRALAGACLNSTRRWEWRVRSASQVSDDRGESDPEADPLTKSRLWPFVLRLPTRQAEIIMQVYMGDGTVKEAAELLGIHETRASQLHRAALTSLRQMCAGLESGTRYGACRPRTKPEKGVAKCQ